MKKFKLEIEMGNDAMQSGFDVAQALKLEVIPRLTDGYLAGVIFDINGNKVGGWVLR